jgi:hypothetical protein
MRTVEKERDDAIESYRESVDRPDGVEPDTE